MPDVKPDSPPQTNLRRIGVDADTGDPVYLDLDRIRKAVLTPEQTAHIDRLCEAMDRETPCARINTGSGRTSLDDWRGLLIQRVLDGEPLPDRWCRDDRNEELEEFDRRYGTREWRKVFAIMAEQKRSAGIIE